MSPSGSIMHSYILLEGSVHFMDRSVWTVDRSLVELFLSVVVMECCTSWPRLGLRLSKDRSTP